MECPKCGKKSTVQVRFCLHCDFEINAPQTAENEENKENSEKLEELEKTLPLKNHKKSLNCFQLLLLGFAFYILLVATCSVGFVYFDPSRKSRIVWCKSNLRQLGTALELYIDMRGRGSRYPPFNGSEFWAHLYRTEVLVDERLYLCPTTDDFNDKGKLLLGTYGSGNPPPTACSYGGRLNKDKKTKIVSGRNASNQPIGCDDDEDSENHRWTVNVLFLDTSARSYNFNPSNPKSSDPELGGKRIGGGILEVCGN